MTRTPMPARHVIISPDALADLEGIWDHIGREAGARIASDFVAEILDTIERLAEMPGMGHRRADVRHPAYRFWSVKSYVIAYRADAQSLRVARVVHGHRNFRPLFPE
jgi:plasmid stabilization system protein ParE